MLPRNLYLRLVRVEGERLVPHFLSERDHGWLSALLEEHRGFAGRKRSELQRRMREPLPFSAPKTKFRAANHVLSALGRDQTAAAVPPREARWVAFQRAAAQRAERDSVLGEAAAELGVSPAELEVALFADLRGEKSVSELPLDLTPGRLAVETNFALVSSLLKRAVSVRITVWDDAPALVRRARSAGLICTVSRAADRAGHVLDVSGPFALFRHTDAYGRALAGLLPSLTRSPRFELRAECAPGQSRQSFVLCLTTGDPIGMGLEVPLVERPLERRFLADFRGAAPDWDLIREPEAVPLLDGSMVFPDFELVQRSDPDVRWWLELAGFWTRDYLETKLRRLETSFDRLFICVDERRCCAEDELPEHAQIIRYCGRLDPKAVLAAISTPTA